MTSTRSLESRVAAFQEDLTKEIRREEQTADPTRCIDIIESLAEEITSGPIDETHKKTASKSASKSAIKTKRSKKVEKSDSINVQPSSKNLSSLEKNMKSLLVTSIRFFRRHKRTALTPEDMSKWEKAIVSADALRSMTVFQNGCGDTSVLDGEKEAPIVATAGGPKSENSELPSSVSSYHARLVAHKKEIYKDPPVLPPPPITINPQTCPLPKRNKTTGEFTFVAGDGADEDAKLEESLKLFRPNRSPEEILRAGAFGGTYYRPITSSVTNVRYNAKQVLQDSLRPEWISGIDKSTMLTSATYRTSVNKFNVKCGGSLGMWESSGWISDVDVYGWFQWYCRFFGGRRCSDDLRQISRWMKLAGPKGRFRSQLCNKILNAGDGGLGKVDDVKISPVIRQTLLHWGLEITEGILTKHGKRVGRL